MLNPQSVLSDASRAQIYADVFARFRHDAGAEQERGQYYPDVPSQGCEIFCMRCDAGSHSVYSELHLHVTAFQGHRWISFRVLADGAVVSISANEEVLNSTARCDEVLGQLQNAQPLAERNGGLRMEAFLETFEAMNSSASSPLSLLPYLRDEGPRVDEVLRQAALLLDGAVISVGTDRTMTFTPPVHSDAQTTRFGINERATIALELGQIDLDATLESEGILLQIVVSYLEDGELVPLIAFCGDREFFLGCNRGAKHSVHPYEAGFLLDPLALGESVRLVTISPLELNTYRELDLLFRAARADALYVCLETDTHRARHYILKRISQGDLPTVASGVTILELSVDGLRGCITMPNGEILTDLGRAPLVDLGAIVPALKQSANLSTNQRTIQFMEALFHAAEADPSILEIFRSRAFAEQAAKEELLIKRGFLRVALLSGEEGQRVVSECNGVEFHAGRQASPPSREHGPSPRFIRKQITLDDSVIAVSVGTARDPSSAGRSVVWTRFTRSDSSTTMPCEPKDLMLSVEYVDASGKRCLEPLSPAGGYGVWKVANIPPGPVTLRIRSTRYDDL